MQYKRPSFYCTFAGCVRIQTQLRHNVRTAPRSAIKATQLLLRRAGLCAHWQIVRKCRFVLHALVLSSIGAKAYGSLCEAYGSVSAIAVAGKSYGSVSAMAVAKEHRVHKRVLTKHKRLRVGVWQR